MSEAAASKTTTGWADVLIDAQRQYMDAWSRMVRPPDEPSGENPQAGASSPLLQGFETWAKMVESALPEENRKLGEHFFDLSRGYLQVAEGMWSLVDGMKRAAEAGTDWEKGWADQIKQFTQTFGAAPHEPPSAGVATFWGMPLQHFRQLASSLSVLPGDVERSVREAGPLGPETLRRALESTISTPTLGYTREWQEDSQRWIELWLEHLGALQEYEAVFARIGARAMEMVGDRLTAMTKEGKTFKSLREAYDLWVDCGEEAYAEIATTPEFARVQAHLTNTLMAQKHHEQQVMNEVQSAINLPTRREIDTTHCRVHHLRRELRIARHRIEALEETVGMLKGAQTPAPSTRKPGSKKKESPKRHPHKED
jgi:class III poly(R)-hydroxyalkanoic acid synthase PhaE subunit